MSKTYILSDKNVDEHYLIRNSYLSTYRNSESLLDDVLRYDISNVLRYNIADPNHFESQLAKVLLLKTSDVILEIGEIGNHRLTDAQIDRIVSLAKEEKLEVALPSGEVLDVHNCYKDAFGSVPNPLQAERFQKFLESLVKKASQSN